MKKDIVIVGSGTGGATVAKELANLGHKATILEKGKYEKLGTEMKAIKFYTGSLLGGPAEKSKERNQIVRTIMVGGSSVVTFANGVPSLEKEFKALGIDISNELKEADKELGISPLPEDLMGERTKMLMKASEELGYDMKPMPKFINFEKCRSCGNCVLGCVYGAKWTSLDFLQEAQKAGAELLINTDVKEVLHSNGEVKGLRVQGPSGVSEVEADNVILAAGGLGTPVILQNSGLNNAGTNLFCDPLVNTYGMVKEGDMEDEIGMGTIIDFHDNQGFIVSPVLDTKLDMFIYLPFFKKLRAYKRGRMFGLMTKITDDDAGRVDPDGTIHKPMTENDQMKLGRGAEISREILDQVGCDPKSIYISPVRAGHPGGTAGIGRVVNNDFETEISRLFVSDCSIFPSAPGKPPVLTIVAFSKRFSRKFAEEYL